MKTFIPGLTTAVFVMAALTACSAGDSGAPTETASTPQFDYSVDPAWPVVPAQWRLGDVTGVAVDRQNNIWVLHRPRTLPAEQAALAAPPVIVFDAQGQFVRAWGGPGEGYEWPQNEHGLYVDDQGFVWVTGNACPGLNAALTGVPSDDQILKFTRDGDFVLQIGMADSQAGNTDTRNVHRAADVHVHTPTSEVFVGDGYGNRRVIVFDAQTGAFKRQWGYNGGEPGDRSPCISTFDTEWRSDQFSVVHSIRVTDDGTVYVADRENSRVQIFTLAGELLGEFRGNGGMIASLALSPDPQQRYLIASEEERGILVIDRASNGIVSVIGTDGLEGPNHLIAVDTNMNIYRASLFGGIIKLRHSGD